MLKKRKKEKHPGQTIPRAREGKEGMETLSSKNKRQTGNPRGLSEGRQTCLGGRESVHGVAASGELDWSFSFTDSEERCGNTPI